MVISPEIGGVLGVVVGLAFTVFANTVLLPYVLDAQKQNMEQDGRPLEGGVEKETVLQITEFLFRFAMPVLFAIVGFSLGRRVFGG